MNCSDTSFYKDSGYEIIEFEELIEGEEKMEYKEQNYRDLYVKTKIEGFVNSIYSFKENFENYNGYVRAEGSYRQKDYFDFLCEMKKVGIERDEIEQIIIKDYLSKKEKE